MRRLVILIVACGVLAGCYTSGQRGGRATMAIYDFGPPPAALAQPVRQSPALEVWAPLWFDSQSIAYRLHYADAARLREYTRARWAGPVAQMIEQRTAQRLGLGMAGQGGARCIVRVEMIEFSQSFSAPANSVGVLRARVALLDLSRRQLAERMVHIERNAPTADARGGVAALTAAVDGLAEQLRAWERLFDGQGTPGCAG